jgi:hypothetical protein
MVNNKGAHWFEYPRNQFNKWGRFLERPKDKIFAGKTSLQIKMKLPFLIFIKAAFVRTTHACF